MFYKRFLLLPLCCIVMIFSAGCNSKTYSVFTNMPEGSFTVTDNSFVTGGIIDGYIAPDRQFEEIDTSNYTSRRGTFYAMTADAELIISDDFTKEGAEENCSAFFNAVKAKLYEIEKSISSSVMNSDIYCFNNADAGAKLEIKKITYDVLSEALKIYNFTGGYYNPALYYNIQAYGFGGAYSYPESAEALPADGIIEKYTSLASHFSDLTLEEDGGKYYLTKPEYTVEVNGETLSMKLDLGGIGKGYAVDCVDALFDGYGYKFGYFNFGISSMLVKSNVLNGEFTVGFSSPRSPSREAYMTTAIRNEKLSTSGDNEQRYFIDGTRYCHVISPKTGKPVQTGIMSVTVIGGSAAESDALTTAIMAMEKEDAVTFISQKLTDKRVVFTFE